MTEDKENHWDDLVSDLGAEPAQQQPEPESEPPQAASDVEPAVKPTASTAKLPPKKSADWNDLASSLGIEPPPTAATESNEADAAEEEVETEAPTAQSDSPSFGGLDDIFAAEAGSAADQRDMPSDSRRDADRGGREEVDDAIFGFSPVEDEPSGELSEADQDRTTEPADRSGEAEEEPRRRRRRRRRRRPRGRPSEEGIEAQPENFAAEMDHIESAVEFAPSSDSDVDKAAGDESIPVTAEVDEETEEVDEVVSQDGDDGREEASAEDATDSTAAPADGRRRKRRRRRGGRRGTRRGEEAEAAEVDDAQVDSEADEEPDEDEFSEKEEGRRRPSHRNIPTWDDAISTIVTTNLAARERAPKESASGGRRGRGRGGRGRRPGPGKSSDRR